MRRSRMYILRSGSCRRGKITALLIPIASLWACSASSPAVAPDCVRPLVNPVVIINDRSVGRAATRLIEDVLLEFGYKPDGRKYMADDNACYLMLETEGDGAIAVLRYARQSTILDNRAFDLEFRNSLNEKIREAGLTGSMSTVTSVSNVD